jgi:hypothetical protein
MKKEQPTSALFAFDFMWLVPVTVAALVGAALSSGKAAVI